MNIERSSVSIPAMTGTRLERESGCKGIDGSCVIVMPSMTGNQVGCVGGKEKGCADRTSTNVAAFTARIQANTSNAVSHPIA